VLMMTRLDRIGADRRRDLLNTLCTIADREAGFRSLGDTWADTTTPHGRLTAHRARRAGRVREGANPHPQRAKAANVRKPVASGWGDRRDDAAPDQGGATPPRQWRADARHRQIV